MGLFYFMKYFLHDSNAFEDEKVAMLFMEYGYEGLGLFYTILEKLSKQEKPIKTSVLKMQLKVGKKLNKCWNFMESIDIISSNNGETFNKQLLNYSEKYKIKKEKNLKRISQWRENQDVEENVTHYQSVRNADKEKKRKVNISKVNILDSAFDEWWDKYDKKVSKEKAITKWNILTNDEKQLALKVVNDYVNSTPVKQYRLNPTTYLHNKSFNDEIINRSPTTSHKPNVSERNFTQLASLKYIEPKRD
jgi:hypothetical protein